MAMGLSCGPVTVEIPDNSWVYIWLIRRVSRDFNTGLSWSRQWYMHAEKKRIHGTKRRIRVFHMQRNIAQKLYAIVSTEQGLNMGYIKYSDRSRVDYLKTDHHLRSIKAAFDAAGINN